MDSKTDSKPINLDELNISITIEKPVGHHPKPSIVHVRSRNEPENIFEPRPPDYKNNNSVTIFYNKLINVNKIEQSKKESNCCNWRCAIL